MPPPPTAPQRAPRNPWLLPVVVLLVSLLATLVETVYLYRTSVERDRARFRNAVQAAEDRLRTRIEIYVNALRGAASMVAASPEEIPQREEFARYVERMRLADFYPGIQGVGLTIHVRARELADFEARMRQMVDPGFRVWPDDPRTDYYAIIYLEPLDRRNTAAIGYDMSTNPVRRSAMLTARDNGVRAASGKVTLVQEIDHTKQAGFLIYVPLYRGGHVPETTLERRRKHLGFVHAPFRANDLFSRIFGSEEVPRIDLEVYAGPSLDEELLLYSSRRADDTDGASHVAVKRFDSEGVHWTIRYRSRPEFEAASTLQFAWPVGLGGTLLSFLLFALVSAQQRARYTAERAAEQLRASETELAALYEEAQQANRAKDEFLATLSHELRTPMTAILGWSRLMSLEDLDHETLREAAQSIHRSAIAQAQLIEDVLDVSRVVTGKLRLRVAETDVNRVAEDAIETVRHAAEAKGVTIAPQLERGGAYLLADASRLQQVLWNLLTNAIRFTPHGGTVRVTVERLARSIRLVVADTGQGISPAFLPHLFEPFRQEDAGSTRQFGGLGLGLAIVRYIVELHGGTIRAESGGAGQGATFTIDLPVATASGSGDAGDDRFDSTDAPASLPAMTGRTILVVDDDAASRDMVAATLRAGGATVVTAESADAAEGMLRARPFDVVVCDIAMPGRDGLSLIRAVRDDAALRSTAAIALTAHGHPDDRARALDAGFDEYLQKPIDPLRLARSVAAHLTPDRPRDS